MIEKLKRPVKIGGTTFREKINELVDAVNELQTRSENVQPDAKIRSENPRLKFRVWYKLTNEYVEIRNRLVLLPDGILCEYDGIEIDSNNYIIEQCTGLKDKNGNLIYEGDIVEITIFGSIGSNGGYVDSDKIYKGAVVWDRDCFLAKTDIDMFLFPYSEDCIEIIGNIHEQAEQKD
jgi:hypothetical protein